MWASFDDYNNGEWFQEQDSSINWTVVNGGGTIVDNASCGTFTAGNNEGNFSNTIQGDSHGDVRNASVNIQTASNPTATNTLAPTNTPTTASANTPTPTRTPTPTQGTAATPTPTKTPTPTRTPTPTYWSSSSPTPTGGYGGPMTGYSKKISPDSVTVEVGKSVQFTMVFVASDGTTWPEDHGMVTWSVVNGGGTINGQGVFTAGSVTGSYSNTVKGVTFGDSAFANVKVVATGSGSGSGSSFYPFTFSVSGYQCATYTQCWEFCRATLGSVDKNECDRHFPGYSMNEATYPVTPYPTGEYEHTVTDKEIDESTTYYNDYYLRYKSFIYPTPTVYISKSPTPTKVAATGKVSAYMPDEPEPGPVFEYLNQRVDRCLQDVYGTTLYREYFAPEGGYGNLSDLGSDLQKAERCMRLNRIADVDELTESCLKKKLGEKRYWVLWSGQQEPTQDELNMANVCFVKPNLVKHEDKKKDKVAMKCVEVKIGSQKWNELKSGGSSLSQEDIKAGRSCFGLDTNVVRPPVVVEPEMVQSDCLRRVLGSQRFNEIYSAKQKPADEEKALVKSCFEDEEAENAAVGIFLPPPPNQVPFIEEDKKDVAIKSAESGAREEKATLILTGKSLPNSLVDIYIYSEPIVLSARTDENGDWSYELAYHLPEGDHEAYTVVRHPDKGLVRSEVFNFGVAYAIGSNSDSTPELLVTPRRSGRNLLGVYLLSAGSLVLLGAAGLLIIYKVRMGKELAAGNVAEVEGEQDSEVKKTAIGGRQ